MVAEKVKHTRGNSSRYGQRRWNEATENNFLFSILVPPNPKAPHRSSKFLRMLLPGKQQEQQPELQQVRAVYNLERKALHAKRLLGGSAWLVST